MRVYSETIFSFIEKCEKMLKDVLKNETSLSVRRKRFERNGYLYPIDVVAFEGQSLGYFDADRYQIGINSGLIYKAKDSVIKDVLRHELAHYLAFIEFGPGLMPHGREFKLVCERHGWPSEISKASMNIDLANLSEGDIASEKTLAKVKNLLKLAESSNPHEAELATLKANQLLLKHNLRYTEAHEDEKLYVKGLMTQKRRNAKIGAVYDILRHFMVRPVLSYGKNQVTLEATGTKTNLELADYVASFLDEELERQWQKIKRERALKGVKAKNSFFVGMAKGYEEKALGMERDFSPEESKALVSISKKLDRQVQRIYNRLSSAATGSKTDPNSYNLGKKAGNSLTINKGVKGKGKTYLLE